MSDEHSILTDFFRRIWREEKGFVYLALKNPSTGQWGRKFFEWPADEVPVVQAVINQRTSHEVYFAPAIFRERSSLKEHILGSFCFWLEFDGKLPVDLGEIPNPSIVVQTSTDTHQHLYWCVDELIELTAIEATNKGLAYQLGADVSGWDANQVLRPPCTLNHKKGLASKLLHIDDRYINRVALSQNITYKPPPKIEFEGTLPSVAEVVRKYSFNRPIWDLFTKGVLRDRSAGLMQLGYFLAEMNLTNIEVLSLLIDADNRWGKFSKRDDQVKRLTEIVTRARVKYPFKSLPNALEQAIISVGHETLLAKKVKADWLWQGLFQQSGYLLLTGPTGVGKSQVSLDFASHLVLGQSFLEREVTNPKKVGFISMEMGTLELQYIRGLQAKTCTPGERQLLEKNLRFDDRGYPLYLNQDENKTLVEEWIEREKVECVIFDSLGSMTQEELSKEKDAKNIMDWTDYLRAQFGISVLIIHHHRKAQSSNKKPNTISDIYGSHYFTSRATTVCILWWGKRNNTIEVSLPKIRLSAPQKPFLINRREDLTFVKTDDRLIVDDTEEETKVPEAEEEEFNDEPQEEIDF